MGMKDEHHTQPSQMMIKPSSSTSALHPKPTSMAMSKNRGVASKTEKKKALVALRLAMLEQGADAVSDIINCPKEELLTPAPTPLTISTNLKGVDQSREQSSQLKVSAMKRADEVKANLSAEHPSLIKHMLHSHIASGFWLGLPKKFCVLHLPTIDTVMELIDESGEVFNARYLAAKAGLSAGWRGFSIAHKLEEGDVVVFHLVQKTTFKVYIIRRNTLGETDGALELLELDTCTNVMISNDDEKHNNTFEEVQEQHQHLDICLPVAGGGDEHENKLSGSPSNEEHGSEVLDWIRFSESESASLESFDKFSILLDRSVSIDAKFPDHIRRKYYDLCTKQNSFLHEKLLKGLNCTLVVGIINETINISDAIRATNTGVQESDLLAWDRTLQSFELLGMDVGFILAQIHRLQGRALELDEAAALEAKAERELARERMRGLEVKFLELKKQMEVIDNEIEVMEESTKRKRARLQEMTSSS